MKSTNRLAIWTCGCVAVCVLTGVAEADEEYEKYLRQTPRVTNIDAKRTADMVAVLRREVQRVLDAGPLAPLRLAYADITYEAYWLYYERGRIITTLALAYPHLADKQQEGARKYIRDMLADEKHAPWTSGIKGKSDGAPRETHGIDVREGRYFDARNCPTLHVLYGLWLYGDRTGDWDAIRPNWAKIKERYVRGGTREVVLYSQMGAHVAMARMGERFGDESARNMAAAALKQDLNAGKDVSKIEGRLKRTRFSKFSSGRQGGRFPGNCWMWMDAPPEIMRFLKDSAKDEVVRRAEAMERRYPKWWLRQAPYFTRWTGDEGVGTTPEIIGMIYPVERWVKDTPAGELAVCMRSAPTGIGDCYWLESLARTIEAFGKVEWRDVTAK